MHRTDNDMPTDSRLVIGELTDHTGLCVLVCACVYLCVEVEAGQGDGPHVAVAGLQHAAVESNCCLGSIPARAGWLAMNTRGCRFGVVLLSFWSVPWGRGEELLPHL